MPHTGPLMQRITRRTLLRSAGGAGLAVTVGSLRPSPAGAAVANRVRVPVQGSSYGSPVTALTLGPFPRPAAGNLLLGVVSVDGSAGAFKPPTGWRIAFQRAGTSISLATVYRIATGTETTAPISWSTASPGGSWLVAEYAGIRSDDPLGPVQTPPYSDAARTSLGLNPAPAESSSILLGLFAIDAMNPGSTGAEFRPTASGWDWVTTSYDAAAPSCPATALTEYGTPLTAAQDLASSTFRWTRSDQVIGAALQLNTGPPAPAVLSRWVGAVTTAGATVAVKAANAASVRLKVATDPTLTADVLFSPPALPDANGNAKLAIDGLAPGSAYHFAVEVDGRLDTVKSGRFRTSSLGAGDFTFAFGSCCDSVGASTFGEIRGHDPDLFIHLGDLHYGNIAANDPAAFRAKYDAALASAHQGPLYATVPTVYTWSDHDYGANGSNGTSASRPAAQSAYRQYVPSYPLPSPTGGIYHSFAYRRIRFIVTDNRSYKSPQSAADDAQKTMLGAEQKQWFTNLITTATEPVIVWVNENPWVGRPSQGVDWWAGYATERAELADFIATSGRNVAIISGDMHALAVDDGSHSPGGMPVFQAAALHGTFNGPKGGPYSLGPYPSTVGSAVAQYGIMQVTDTGTAVSLAFTGYEAGGTARMTHTKTFTV